MTDVPDCPREAALKKLQPPAPAPSMPVGVDVGAIAVAAAAEEDPAVAAQHRIQGRLLTLAREIRRPKAYVGYSAFVLMGLLKRCRPCVWEGASFIDLLAVFCSWAADSYSAHVPVVAIPCAVITHDGGCCRTGPHLARTSSL